MKTCPPMDVKTQILGGGGLVQFVGSNADTGEYMGELVVSAQRDPEAAVVGSSKVESAYRRCGVGTRLYEAALHWACRRGRKLQSDGTRSRFAEAFWRKQESKGRARCIPYDPDEPYNHPRGELFRPDDDRESGEGVFVQNYWDCGYYQMNEACPQGLTLRGRRRKRKRRGRGRRRRRR